MAVRDIGKAPADLRKCLLVVIGFVYWGRAQQ